ncbi:MAG: hypothetical protein K5985_00055 [Lachnospiraceae bacterium]|nr:hypothetical protein [Lachnospiraceae bacterium]
MKGFVLKSIFFIAVFILSAIMFSRFLNQSDTDMTGTMTEARLPIVYAFSSGRPVNPMHPITSDMDVSTVRGPLTILEEDRSLGVLVDLYNADVDRLSYEVRSIDGSRLIENTEVSDPVKENGTLSGTLHIKDLIRSRVEYMLVVVLEIDGKKSRYFTRILKDDELHTKELLDFVADFSSTTFDKRAAQKLTQYLESSAQGDNTTFDTVTIHSSFDQITWGSLSPTPPEKTDITILDMDVSTSSFLTEYHLSIGDDSYDVREYYRLRYSEKRIYLLDYERNMEEIFTQENSRFINDKAILGIRSGDVNMEESPDGTIISFVQNGSLYSYRETDKRLVRVFSFRCEEADLRCDYSAHGIKILQTGENGSLYFGVYGYMNRGRHEGDTGVSIFYYDSSLNQTEELVYIPYKASYERLMDDASRLFFYNGGNLVYICLHGSIYRISLESRKADKLSEPSEIVASESHSRAACLEGEALTVIDFYSGRSRQVSETGARPLGFIGDDFVYGVSSPEDTVHSLFGSSRHPMHSVIIEDETGDTIKTYSRPGVYVTGADMKDGEVILHCVSFAGDRIIDLPDEEIMHNVTPEKARNTIFRIAIEDKETITEISMMLPSRGKIQNVTPREVLYDSNRMASVPSREIKGRFYTYSRGTLTGTFSDPVKAIETASDGSGVVVNDAHLYIWRKGKQSKAAIEDISFKESDKERDPLAACLDAVLAYTGVSVDTGPSLSAGISAGEILSENLQGNVLPLAGTPLQNVLYYICEGNPVLAGKYGSPVLLVGYDANTLTVLSPSGESEKINIDAAEEVFSSGGNDFMSYILQGYD